MKLEIAEVVISVVLTIVLAKISLGVAILALIYVVPATILDLRDAIKREREEEKHE